jgi:hypothetical protein
MRRQQILLGTLALTLLLLGLLAGLGLAQGPQPPRPLALEVAIGTAFTYQGRLESDGGPVNATCGMQFGLFDHSAGGAPMAAISSTVPISDGLFTVSLDFGEVFTGTARWLGVKVKCPGDSGYTTLTPRQALTPVPYALALPGLWTQQNPTSPNLIGGYSGNWVTPAACGATIGGGGRDFYANRVTDNYGTIGGGSDNQAGNNTGTTSDCVYATVGGGHGNDATREGATIGGGYSNSVSGHFGTVSGGSYNTADSAMVSIGGGEENHAITGTHITIGGGYNNTASGNRATIAGGDENTIDESSGTSVIGGGEHNSITGAFASAIAGGGWNAVSGGTSFVGGGYSHVITGNYGTIGGGWDNEVRAELGTVGGGFGNTTSGSNATVGGGDSNTASGDLATVGGGGQNTASGGFLGSGGSATVGGGHDNTASGASATVGGGAYNTASGGSATVPGGYNNVAQGNKSFAAGSGAWALHTGAFVWADSYAVTLTSPITDSFVIRARGGVTMYTHSSLGSGSYLAPGGSSWNGVSDRARKENLEPVNSQELLARLAGIEVSTWNYTSQDPSIRHIGAMAQDFNALLPGLGGEGEEYINSLDADGVSLAAIQGLYQLYQVQEARIAELEAESAELRTSLDSVEGRLATLEAGSRPPLQASLLPGAGFLLAGLAVCLVTRRRESKP